MRTNKKLSFEQLSVGQSASLTQVVTLELIDSFASLSGDHSAIHVDPTAARMAGYDGQVAHGAISQCFFSALIGTQLPGDTALLLELTSRFRLPIIVGDTMVYEAAVAELHEATRCITLKLTGRNQRGEKAVSGKALVKIRP